MPTIDQVQKQYDKLTDRERYALIVAAAQRDDMSTRDALVNSAPAKMWKVKNHYGLLQGFQFASAWYMLEQQSDLMIIFWMFYTYSDDPAPIDMTFEGHKVQADPEEIAGKLIRRVLARWIAWDELCQEYKIDPAAHIEPYPRYTEMMMLIGLLKAAADEKGEEAQPSDIQTALEDMRATIEKCVKDWE